MSKEQLNTVPLNMNEFNRKLSGHDPSAWERMYINCKSYFKKWSKEDRIEIMWIAKNDKIFSSADKVYKKIFVKVRMDYDSEKPVFGNVIELKEFVKKTFSNCVNTGFKTFLSALKRKIDAIWNVFYHRMYRCLIISIYMKQKMDPKDADKICVNTLGTFFDKILVKEDEIENSKGLKSFVYNIGNKKLLEYYREKSKIGKVKSTDDENGFVLYEPDDVFNSEADKQYVKHLLNQLDETENEILRRYFFLGFELKEIAEQLNKTQENIRIIKFRAIEKLRNYIKNPNI